MHTDEQVKIPSVEAQADTADTDTKPEYETKFENDTTTTWDITCPPKRS